MPQFDITVDEAPADEEPKIFTISGTIEGERWTETFACLPRMPVGFMADLGRVAIPVVGGWAVSATHWTDLIAGALDSVERARFDDLIHDPVRVVDSDSLAKVGMWVVEVYSNRPTTPPADSQNGRVPTGATSTGG